MAEAFGVNLYGTSVSFYYFFAELEPCILACAIALVHSRVNTRFKDEA